MSDYKITSRAVTLTLTHAEAKALLGFACEGEECGRDALHDGLITAREWAAGSRATDLLRHVGHDLRHVDTLEATP